MDKKKMIELKRKNAVNNICKEWVKHGIKLSIDNFLDVDSTLQIQNMIIKKLDEMDFDKSHILCSKKNTITEYVKHLSSTISREKKYIFFETKATTFGAIQIQGDSILDNISWFIDESELNNGSCCIFIVSTNLDKGICLWRGEYDTRLYIW